MASRTILIADDDAGLVEALKLRCQSLGVVVRTASNGREVLSILRDRTPDMLILDINMPAVDGLGVGEKLMRDPSFSPLPVIFFSGQSDPETVARCEALGAHYVFKGVDTWEKLKPLICEILQCQKTPERPPPAAAPSPDAGRETAAAKLTVLLVDDDYEFVEALRVRLEASGMEVLTAFSGMQGFWKAQRHKPDVIVTDYVMPRGDGEGLLIRLKINPMLQHIPVIVLTGKTRAAGEKQDLKDVLVDRYGAAALLTKPVVFKVLVKEIRRHVDRAPALSVP